MHRGGNSLDRQIVYPGAIPLDTDLLNTERSVLVALGYLARAALGSATVADGLACLPTTPSSMTVMIGPGSITQLGVVDSEAFGSLPAETTESLVQMGINLADTNFLLAAPTGSGQAINYLIEASFLQTDASSVVLPYYNAANPGMPYSGPGNSGALQNTQRLQRVQFQLKAGAPSAAGTQTTPTVDAGWVGLYVITVPTGTTAVTSGDIAVMPTAPFVPWKLPQLTPGTSRLAVFTPASQANWAVPAGVSNVKVRLWGGGGAGGAGFGGAGGGGAGGGYCEGFYAVSPGQSFFVTVGNGGIGSGTSGGVSSFGSMASADGGAAGANGASGVGGNGAGAGGTASGSGVQTSGGVGGGAFLAGSVWVSGRGGAAYGAAGAEPVIAAGTTTTDGHSATLPGCGGSGGIGGGVGGQGGAGLVLLEW
jgi:hypothetical protein